MNSSTRPSVAGYQTIPPSAEKQKTRKDIVSAIILGVAGINCIFQMAWFWPCVSRNINYDAISYIGIARHLLDGHLRESLHGYWSPLISWLIAGMSLFTRNLTLAGHVATIFSFVLCLPFIYLFTFRLWRSHRLAALAVLWFTLTHDVTAFSAFFIGADFLFCGATLLYFMLLLNCLRQPTGKNWGLLGIAHGLAFLAKAFAMPWLTLSTLLAAALATPRKKLAHAALAMMIPLLVWSGWGFALRAKYHVFTPGYQSKWNLLDVETRAKDQRGKLAVLFDTSQTYDAYTVVDTMFPGAPAWKQRTPLANTLPIVLARLRHNLPEALKQLAIFITPGGILALILVIAALRRRSTSAESILIQIAIFNTATLLIGYSLLVFDNRYVLPLIPILIAITIPLVVPWIKTGFFGQAFARARLIVSILVIAGLAFFQIYWASPFRTLRRDYQTSVYATVAVLRSLPSCSRMAVIGAGPFPEHGVGWEAGIYASYFSGCRIVAFGDRLPSDDQSTSVESDLREMHPNVVLVFGSKSDPRYRDLLGRLAAPQSDAISITDPAFGEVGSVLTNISNH